MIYVVLLFCSSEQPLLIPEKQGNTEAVDNKWHTEFRTEWFAINKPCPSSLYCLPGERYFICSAALHPDVYMDTEFNDGANSAMK